MSPRKPLPPAILKSPDELSLDPSNPRLAGHDLSIERQDEILLWLYREMAVNELLFSIATNGYWQHEELFAAQEDGHLVVLEGNRRLCAVKLLLDPELRTQLKISDPPPLAEGALETLQTLPVIVASRDRIWDYIGFKHVNGARAWDSIAKAQYIYRVRTKFGVPLEQIAKTMADQHDTVVRLYRGYLVLRQAQEAGIFDPDDSYRRKLPFSHLWTAINSYVSVQDYLGLERARMDEPNPVPVTHQEELKNLMLWLFGSRSEGIEPRVQRQNPDLRRLAESLSNDRGLRKLEAGLPLDVAFDASLGDERLFADALTKAEQFLRDAKSYVATGYAGDDELLDTANDIFRLATSLYREMESQGASSED